MAVQILCMDSPKRKDGDRWVHQPANRKSVGQVLVPGPAHHTFATDSWSLITASRALVGALVGLVVGPLARLDG